MAKQLDAPYIPGKRKGMAKVKRERTIDCVVMGWRPGKEEGTVGSLILGLYDGERAALGRPHLRLQRRGETEHAGDAGAAGDGRERQRRAEPLDRRARPRVGGAAAGAGDRGRLRPCGGGADPARGAVPPVPGRQRAARSAGSSSWTKGARRGRWRRVLSRGEAPAGEVSVLGLGHPRSHPPRGAPARSGRLEPSARGRSEPRLRPQPRTARVVRLRCAGCM